MRILLAEDHECVRWGLREMLSKGFTQVSFGEAANSREATEVFYQETWDCVLLDIELPGRSGLDLLEEFTQAKPTVPILVVSGYPEGVYGLRALKSGAHGYVNKTSAAAEIVTAVQRVLSGRKYISDALAEILSNYVGGNQELPPHESLSNREFQVMRMLASGKTNTEIAAELSLSEQSISTYRSRLLQKLGLTNNAEVVRYAMEHRVIGKALPVRD